MSGFSVKSEIELQLQTERMDYAKWRKMEKKAEATMKLQIPTIKLNQNNLILNFTKLIGFEREIFLKHGRVEAYQ